MLFLANSCQIELVVLEVSPIIETTKNSKNLVILKITKNFWTWLKFHLLRKFPFKWALLTIVQSFVLLILDCVPQFADWSFFMSSYSKVPIVGGVLYCLMRMSRKWVERKGDGAGNVFFFSFSIFLFLFLMWRGEWRRGCRLVMWSGQSWQPWHPCHSSTSSQCNQEQYARCTRCAKKSRSEKCRLQGNWLAMSSLDKDLQFVSVCHHKAKPIARPNPTWWSSFTLKHLNPRKFYTCKCINLRQRSLCANQKLLQYILSLQEKAWYSKCEYIGKNRICRWWSGSTWCPHRRLGDAPNNMLLGHHVQSRERKYDGDCYLNLSTKKKKEIR